MSARTLDTASESASVSLRLARVLAIPLAVVLIAAVAVFFVLYDTSQVVGESMLPNLMPQDRVLVTKSYLEPARGDIVVGDFVTVDGSSPFVKRVIALAGDEVVFSGDDIWVDGSFADYPGVLSRGATEEVTTVVVPAGHVFIAGDNRPDSWDSRYVGTVPVSQVRGRAVAIFTPVTRIGPVPSGGDHDPNDQES